MWGLFISGEVPTARNYKCSDCEVFGHGDECWRCGSTDLTHGWAHTVGGHRHNPAVKYVTHEGVRMYVGRELQRIIL